MAARLPLWFREPEYCTRFRGRFVPVYRFGGPYM